MMSRNIRFEMATVNENRVSSASPSDLDLHMPFEVPSYEEDRDEHLQHLQSKALNRFESEATYSSKSDETSEDEVDSQRRGNTDW